MQNTTGVIDHQIDNQNQNDDRTEQRFGVLLQAVLGILLGFSTIQYFRYFAKFPIDEVAFLYIGLALLLPCLYLKNTPKLQLFIGCRLRLWAGLGFCWYLVISIISYLKFHSGAFATLNSPAQSIAIATHALLALPCIIAITCFIAGRRKPLGAIPKWSVIVLFVCILSLPYNAQLGELPLCCLAFLIAFYSGFLAKSPKTLFYSIAIAATATLAVGMYRYLAFTPMHYWGQARFATLYPWGMHGLIPHNFLAQCLVIVVSATAALLCYAHRNESKILLKLMLGIMVLCIVMTQSRGAIVGLAAMLVAHSILTWSDPKKKWLKIACLALPFALLIIVMLINVFIKGQTVAFGGEGRVELAKIGFDQFKHNPIVGNGISSWRFDLANPCLSNSFIDCHNALVEILCDTGLIGLMVATVLISAIGAQCRGLRKVLISNEDRAAFKICIAGAIGFLVTLLFHIAFWYQNMTPMIPVLFGVWWGVATSQNVQVSPAKTKSNASRLGLVLLIVASVVLSTIVSSYALSSDIKSMSDALSYKSIVNILKGKYLEVQEWGHEPVVILDKSPVEKEVN